MNNTILGEGVPLVPQWSGPPRTIIQVQAMLYASLAASLFSAFLAMLGKQWLNRYASTDMRGTAIERSQNRQRKHDGIITWYFDHVMESLPLMLQFALLLLGCALSRYIWGIDTTVASVVLGVTSVGVFCYVLIMVAGSVSMSCPYQTPGAQILRCLWQKVPRSTFYSTKWPARQDPGTQDGPEPTPDQESTALDFPCISWMLRTSLDRGINRLTLKFLTSVLMSPGFETTIVTDCFNILASCISITSDSQVVVLRGLEQLAETAAACLLSTLSHSMIVAPKSNILKDVHQQYNRTFPHMVNIQGLPFCHTISGLHNLFDRHDHPRGLEWKGVDYSAPENLPLAHNLVKIAWLCYQKSWSRGKGKVPRWILYFSFHCLLQDPDPPMPIISICLWIVAIDLGCNVSDRDIRNLDKGYVSMPHCIAHSSNHPPACTLGMLNL